jgi:hypothetical protein
VLVLELRPNFLGAPCLNAADCAIAGAAASRATASVTVRRWRSESVSSD